MTDPTAGPEPMPGLERATGARAQDVRRREPDGGGTRRDLLRTALIAAGSALAPPGALAQAGLPALLPAAGAPFSAATVPDLARALARQPYLAPRLDDLPDALRNLTREQYAAIRTAPGAAVWSEAGLGFAIEPLHRGAVYTDRVGLFLVEEGTVRPLAYARDRFETSGPALPDPGPGDLGFSGLRLRARLDGEMTDFAVFQGVSFFRLVARGQGFGVNARALMLRPADPRGEDYARWRAFFVERPGPEGTPLVLHALVEAESCTAAFRMSLRPGDAAVVETEAAVFTRTAVDHLGLGGAQTSFLFGPIDRRGLDDARAAAHASSGLQIRNGGNEALWRPVHNPRTLQISSFLDDGPQGFGLMQRPRDYAAFQDDVQRWERRPSLLIEPMGASGIEGLWGPGAVTLLEIPSDSEINENVIAYWRPRAVVPAGAEFRFRYRQTWCWQPPDPGPGEGRDAERAAADARAEAGPPEARLPEPPAREILARVSGTRGGRGANGGRRLFLVDFTGDILFVGPDGPPELRLALGASPGAITRQAQFAYPERRTVRVAFELDPGGGAASELRLALKAGERQVSETWLYRWTA